MTGSETETEAGPAAGADRQGGAASDAAEVARTICLQLLDRAPRTRGQLAETLRRRGVPEDAAAAALDRLAQVGLVDDRAFAAAWVSSRQAGRGLAGRALAGELRRRGVDAEVVAEAVATIEPEAEELAARTLVARRLPALRGVPEEARRRRLVALLLRRGYPTGLAARVVDDALGSRREAVDPDDRVVP